MIRCLISWTFLYHQTFIIFDETLIRVISQTAQGFGLHTPFCGTCSGKLFYLCNYAPMTSTTPLLHQLNLDPYPRLSNLPINAR
jgi:hypothetical protein